MCKLVTNPLSGPSHKRKWQKCLSWFSFFLGSIFFSNRLIFFLAGLIFVSAVWKRALSFGDVVEVLGNYFLIFHPLPHPPIHQLLYNLYTSTIYNSMPPVLTILPYIRLPQIFFIWFTPRIELLTFVICNPCSFSLNHTSNHCQHANFSWYH